MAKLIAILLLALGAQAVGAPTIPSSPAGRMLSDWLAAFNSADEARVLTFRNSYGRELDVASTLAWRESTGGFDLLRVEERGPLAINALLKERDSDTALLLDLTIKTQTPAIRGEMRFRRAPLPVEFAPARLSQSEAAGALTARANQLANEDRFSGVLLAARGDEILVQRAVGKADRERGTPVTLDTQFRMGSMNKMFTAIATLQLVEAGKVGLDDALGKHLPDYPNKDVAAKVTVRHLLTHTGGTGDIFGAEFEANRTSLKEHSDYLRLYGQRGPAYPPGTEFGYSNYGYVLLGALIEKLTGRSYYDYAETHIFRKAGMTATGSIPESTTLHGRAIGYMRKGDAWIANTETLPYRGTAAGGGYSTVRDLLRFARALESGKLVSWKLLAQATRESAPGYGYGFGFVLQGEGPLRSYGHGGGAPGMNGDLRIFPELGYVVVVLSNLDPPGATRLVDHFAMRMPTTP